MKALILAGGRGSRLNEFTKNKNKSMIKLFEKPLIEYNLDQAVEANVKEIIIVVGYKKEDILKYVGREYKGIPVKYAIQKQQKGLVHAIECAKEKIGKSDFILMLGDEIVIEAKIKEMVKKFYKEKLFAVCGTIIENDKSSIRKTYSAMVNEENKIFRLIEKPQFPINNIKGTGHCIFNNEILKYIKKTPISMKRGEKELVDMIQEAIDEGKDIRAFNISENYVNVNDEEDLNLATKMLMRSNPRVLIVHPQMEYFGGAELLIVELANLLTKKGIKNDILTASKSKEIEKKLIKTKLIVPETNIKISSAGFNSIKDILGFIKIFRKEIKKRYKEYDVINFHNFPSTWTIFPRILNKKSCVWMLNEPPNLWSRPNAGILLKIINQLRILADRFIIRNSIDVICVADEFNKKRCLERYGLDSKIIYYGVNHEFFSNGNKNKAIKKFGLKGKFVVVQSGILSEVKNQIESIKAVEKIKNNIPNIILVLAGTPEKEYKNKLEKYILKNNLQKYVLFTGNLNRGELRDLYKAADVGLFPVGKQGGWLAPFELLCSGNPIIVSKEIGASSIIKKHNLGIVTGDYANSLIKVYNNKKEYKKKAKNASEIIKKNFGWNNFSDKMIDAYRTALKKYN